MKEDVREALEEQAEMREMVEELKDDIAYHRDQIEQLEAEIDDMESEMPEVVRAGIVREGGSNGRNRRVDWISEVVRDEDGREFLRCGEVPVDTTTASRIPDDIFEDVLPDLRQNGFKGRVAVEQNDATLLEYESPTDLHDRYYDPEQHRRIVEADAESVSVPVADGLASGDAGDLAACLSTLDDPSRDDRQNAEAFIEYLDECGLEPAELAAAIEEEIRSRVASVNAHVAETVGPTGDLSDRNQRRFDKSTWVQTVKDGDIVENYEVRHLDESGLLTFVDLEGGSHPGDYDLAAVQPDDISDLHPDGEWPRRTKVDGDWLSVASRSSGMLNKFIRVFPDGKIGMPTFQFRIDD